MDRRGFFKTILSAPLFAPLLLSSSSSKGNLQLYIIADSPQLFLPLILQELQNDGLVSGFTFTLLNPHPEEKDLKRSLVQKGWRYMSKENRVAAALSFNILRKNAPPSFTLIRSGKIWDIRSKRLYALWKEMNNRHSLSTWLTQVSFKGVQEKICPGNSVFIYMDGQKIENVTLKKNSFRSFRTKRGNISIVVENGKAWVSESSCCHRICLLSPPVSSAGERIICAPNHFLLEVSGSHSIDTSIG